VPPRFYPPYLYEIKTGNILIMFPAASGWYPRQMACNQAVFGGSAVRLTGTHAAGRRSDPLSRAPAFLRGTLSALSLMEFA